MHISDVERLTGLTRANIRFYEKQGLLLPNRLENGYRDYQRPDVELLKKIRLLREVGVSLDDIGCVIAQPDSLAALLEKHMGVIQREIQQKESALTVCREMRQEGADFAALDADKYLERMSMLSRMQPAQTIRRVNVFTRDVEPFVPRPWRRLLARFLDLLLCNTLVALLLEGVLGVYLTGVAAILHQALGLLFMLLLEPLCLKWWATTPGKWVFGIRLTDDNGQKLSYQAGIRRTGAVLVQGMGLNLPIICWLCLFFARKRYVEGGCTSWDYENDYQVNVRSRGKFILSVVVGILLLAFCQEASQLLSRKEYLPPHQGDVTLAQFAENYNYIVQADARQQGTDVAVWLTDMLDEQGRYRTDDGNRGVVIVGMVSQPPMELHYTLENGTLQAVSFQAQLDVEGFFTGYQDEMRRILFALGDLSAWDGSIRRMDSRTRNLSFQSYAWEDVGVKVQCDVTWNEGEWVRLSDRPIYLAEEKQPYAISFRAEKIDTE